MDIFNPLVTLLMFVIILRLYYELGIEKKKVDKLTEYVMTGVNEELDGASLGISNDIITRDMEFDNRIAELKEELGQTQEAYLDMLSPKTVADVLDENVYNLSRDEILLLEQQMKMEGMEYAD